MWLKLDALHPEDGSLPVEDRPEGALRAGDMEAFEDFLNFLWAGAVAQGDAVAGLPGAEGGLGDGRGVNAADFDAEAIRGSVCGTGDGDGNGHELRG